MAPYLKRQREGEREEKGDQKILLPFSYSQRQSKHVFIKRRCFFFFFFKGPSLLALSPVNRGGAATFKKQVYSILFIYVYLSYYTPH